MVTRLRRTHSNKKAQAQSPGPLVARCSLPDAARIHRHHRLAYLAAKRLAELVEVLHCALRPPLARAMRIGLGLHTRCFFRLVIAPHLTEGDEEPLRRRIAVLLSIDITRLGV